MGFRVGKWNQHPSSKTIQTNKKKKLHGDSRESILNVMKDKSCLPYDLLGTWFLIESQCQLLPKERKLINLVKLLIELCLIFQCSCVLHYSKHTVLLSWTHQNTVTTGDINLSHLKGIIQTAVFRIFFSFSPDGGKKMTEGEKKNPCLIFYQHFKYNIIRIMLILITVYALDCIII